MLAHTIRYVSFSDVLSRLGLPSQEDVDDFVDFFFGWCDYSATAASFQLVPWSVLADDISDCMIEMGYEAPDINEIYPKSVLLRPQPNQDVQYVSTENIYVDLES